MPEKFRIEKDFYWGRWHIEVFLICPVCGQMEARLCHINPDTGSAIVLHWGCAHFWPVWPVDYLPDDVAEMFTSKEPGEYGVSILSVIGSDGPE